MDEIGEASEPSGTQQALTPAGGWLDPARQRAWRNFQVMQARLNAVLAHDLATHCDLTYQEYVVLVALTDQPCAQLRVYQLGEMLGWEKSRVSHQVTRMAERGLVAKSRCGPDRRGATVQVTSRGWSAIKAAAPSHVEAVRRYFVDVLSDGELEALGDLSARVVAVIEADQGPVCSGTAGVQGSGPGPLACGDG